MATQPSSESRPVHPVRFVTAASLFDGHDVSINIMRRILQSQGAEVVHLGHDRSVDDVVTAAVQEDVQGVAISSYQGGHVEYFSYLVQLLKERGAGHVRVYGGGGGVIVPEEIELLAQRGVRIFSPEEGQQLGLTGMVSTMVHECDVDLATGDLDVDAVLAGEQSALGRAITGHELRVLYQPIVSLAHEQVIGAEALVRWERPGFGLLRPDEFIPIAEESSLISAVDCWILQEACRRGAQWCKAGGTIAINLSARTLQQDDVVHALSQSLRRTAISPAQLTLEITETTLLGGIGATEQNLGRLRALGVKLSIDDFGTGHSSLSQLQQTDVDILKIDQSFVSVMDQDPPSAAIVSAIITLGHAMGLTLVAEGVERPAQAALLREQGCDAAQGWLFGQPLPAEAVDLAFGITFPALTPR